MFSKLRFALLLPLAALLACGSNPTATPSASNTLNFSGDWGATATIFSLNIPITGFLGALSASGGTVSGELVPMVDTGCTSAGLTPVAVSGTVSANGDLTVTLPVGGGTATLTATLTGNPETLVGGTYLVVGGTCAMSATPMVIAQFAPLTGTFTGTFNPISLSGSPGPATTITTVLTQSTTPNANAMFPIAGTVTATGACTASFTLSSNSIVWGGTLTAFDPTESYLLVGSFYPTGTTSQLASFTSETASSSCPSQIFAGTLTRQ